MRGNEKFGLLPRYALNINKSLLRGGEEIELLSPCLAFWMSQEIYPNFFSLGFNNNGQWE